MLLLKCKYNFVVSLIKDVLWLLIRQIWNLKLKHGTQESSWYDMFVLPHLLTFSSEYCTTKTLPEVLHLSNGLIHSFIHWTNVYWPLTVLGMADTAVNKTKSLPLWCFHFWLWWKAINKYIICQVVISGINKNKEIQSVGGSCCFR